jgi:hypothetical protein
MGSSLCRPAISRAARHREVLSVLARLGDAVRAARARAPPAAGAKAMQLHEASSCSVTEWSVGRMVVAARAARRGLRGMYPQAMRTRPGFG